MPTSSLNDWTNVIHLTVDGDNRNYSNRTPGVWFQPDNYLYFNSALNDLNGSISTSATRVQLMEWTKVNISQLFIDKKYVFSIEIAGTEVFTSQNTSPKEFQNVKVYLSDPWYYAQPGFIRKLVILNTCEEFFSMIEEKEIKKNQMITILNNLPKEYELSFEVNLTSDAHVEWSNIIHLTIGGNMNTYGDRTPGVWIHWNKIFYFASALNGDLSSYFETNINLSSMDWTKIRVSQLLVEGKYVFAIWVAENNIYYVVNNDAREFHDVKVYIGNPWYEAQPGYVRNLVIKNVVGSNHCKPLIKVIFEGLFTNKNHMSLSCSIDYAYEPGVFAYNITWEYFLPVFMEISSASEAVNFHKNGSKFTIPGAFNTTGVNHNLNLSSDMTSILVQEHFPVEILLKLTFQNSAGILYHEYKTYKINSTSDANLKILRNKNALPESYGRGICWDAVESLVYVCMNQYVISQNVACFYSKSDGEFWTGLDMQVGSVLGHNLYSRDLYAIHRNQKSYLMYNRIFKKWLTISNAEYVKNILYQINQNGCKKLEENDKQVYSSENQQWMGNDDGLYFRKSINDSWIQRIKWNNFF